MKHVRILFLSIVLVIGAQVAQAQCPMCKASVESSLAEGNKRAKGLNAGILYLLAVPYLAVSAVGFIWYKKYRKKQVVASVNN